MIDHAGTLTGPSDVEMCGATERQVKVVCSCGYETNLHWWRSHAEHEYAGHWLNEEAKEEKRRKDCHARGVSWVTGEKFK